MWEIDAFTSVTLFCGAFVKLIFFTHSISFVRISVARYLSINVEGKMGVLNTTPKKKNTVHRLFLFISFSTKKKQCFIHYIETSADACALEMARTYTHLHGCIQTDSMSKRAAYVACQLKTKLLQLINVSSGQGRFKEKNAHRVYHTINILNAWNRPNIFV